MTLLPVEEGRIGWQEGIESRIVADPLGPYCAVPWCDQVGAHKHHIIPRSKTAGPREWVIIDGLTVRNTCRLCAHHHLEVTGGIGGHQARITWDLERGWLWHDRIRIFEEDGTFVSESWDAGAPLQLTKETYGPGTADMSLL